MAVRKSGRACPAKTPTVRPMAAKSHANSPAGRAALAVHVTDTIGAPDWQGGWWVTMAPRQFGAEMGFMKPGQELAWPALPGVGVGDVFVLVTTAPDRRLRAWAQVVCEPRLDEEGDWHVTLRFGATLERPIALKTLKVDPALANWPALTRVTSGRLEAIPPALWQRLNLFMRPQVAEVLAAAPAVTAVPARKGRSGLRATSLLPPPDVAPWLGLDRGGIFRELAQRFFWPQRYSRVELKGRRDDVGIDIVAHRPQPRWTKVVAQLDYTGEPVEPIAIEELIRGKAIHGAPQALLIALGPVTVAARALAAEHQIEVWDEAAMQALWMAAKALELSAQA